MHEGGPLSGLPPALRETLRGPLKWAAMFSLVINLALVAPSLFMLQVYDRVLVTRSVETLSMLLVLTVLTLGLFGVLDHARSRLLAIAGLQLERSLGPRLLERLIDAQARQRPSPALDGLRDLATLRAALSGPAAVAVFDAPWALIYLVLIGLFDLRLGLLALAAAAGLLLLAVLNHRSVRQSLQQLQPGQREAQRLADRAIENAEVVTALGMSGALAERWSQLTGAAQAQSLAAAQGSSRLSASSRTLRQGVQVAMMALGAWLVIRDGASPGVMIATTLILGRALVPIEQLIGGWAGLVEARAAQARLAALLAEPEEAARLSLPRPGGLLQVEGLSQLAPQGGRVLLRQLSFTVQPGELLALVGPSGAGKTTLARLLVGVLQPHQGVVRLDGADLRHHDPLTLGAALGYLPQDVELFAGTVAENIARFGAADAQAVLSAAQAAGAHELIQRLPQGYDTPVGDAGRQLSGGQRQRVALARALYGEPSLLVLDEPDASLDAEGEEALAGALVEAAGRGATVIVITQRRRLLGLAQRVMVLRDGAIERLVTREQASATTAVEVRQA